MSEIEIKNPKLFSEYELSESEKITCKQSAEALKERLFLAQLQEENARLKKESEENQDLATIAYMQGMNKNKVKLDKAKEIIRLFLSERFNESEWQNIQGKAEVFLKESGE